MTDIQQKIVDRNLYLREYCLSQNQDCFKDKRYRMLLHYPNNGALRYMFESWCMCLNFMGIETSLLPFPSPGESPLALFEHALDSFKPNIFVTAADAYWLSLIDAQMLVDRGIMIGHLGGPHTEVTTNDTYDVYKPCHFIVDFFLKSPSEIQGVPIHKMKFGANPLVHYATGIGDKYNWFYAGHISDTKRRKAESWMFPVVRHIKGGILAGSWNWVDLTNRAKEAELIATEFYNDMGNANTRLIDFISIDEIKDYYSNTICSLNFHQDDQINTYINCNERTFIIPACCGFEVCDHPMAINDMYERDEMVYVNSKWDYFTTVLYFCEHPDERWPYVEKALNRTYLEHTWFHSLQKFVGFLDMVVDNL